MTLPTSSPSLDSKQIARPTAQTRTTDQFIAQFTNRLEEMPGNFGRKRLPSALAPKPEQRAWLESRRKILRHGLTPTPGPAANKWIMLLLAGKKGYGATGQETTVQIGLYARALAGEPTWAIKRAQERFSRPGWRSSWDGSGWPSDAEVVAECRYETHPYRAELNRIEAILDAEIYDNEVSNEDREVAIGYWEKEVKPEMRSEDAFAELKNVEIAAKRTDTTQTNEPSWEYERARAASQDQEGETWVRLPSVDVPKPAADEHVYAGDVHAD